MKKLLLVFSLVSLLLPVSSQALFFLPTGTLVVVTQTSLDGVFNYQLKEGTFPFDELNSFEVTTAGGVHTYSYEYLTAFPTKYRLSQVLVDGLELTMACSSTLGTSVVNVTELDARIQLYDGDTVTCTFTNTQLPNKNSLLIIPGIMGTELLKGDDKLWPDSTRMLATPNDRFMDPLAFLFSGEPVDYSVESGSVVSREATLNYTEKLVTDLHSLGYTANQDLFLFPYDWRKELGETANGPLRAKFDELLASNGQGKIDIVAHSQGGLVLKKLLYDHPQYKERIGKLIFVGTPHLGAPKAAKALLYGDSMGVSFAGLGLDPEEIKRIAQHMPAVYELLPSAEYFDHYVGYLGEAKKTSLFGDWEAVMYNKSQTNASLAGNGLDAGLIHTADDFHSTFLDNLNFTLTNVDAYNIVGCQEATLTEIFQRAGGKFLLKFNAGDGTVPVKSATNVFGVKTYYALATEHGKMLTEDGTRQQIINLLSGNEAVFDPLQMTTESTDCQLNGQVVSVHSPVDLHVYDSLGNHTGKDANGNLELDIPHSNYETVGEEKFVFLPPGNFRVELRGTGEGAFSLYRETISGGQVTQTQNFVDVPVSPSLLGIMVLADESPSVLEIDNNSDGAVDQMLTPNILNAAESTDLLPPSTTLSLAGDMGEANFYRSSVVAALNASDTSESDSAVSGVLQTKWRVNGDAWQTYATPVQLSAEGQYLIEYFSTDKAGNTEAVQSANITIDKTSPEAKMIFNPTTEKLSVTGTEPVTIVDVGTIVSLKDKAGNTTEVQLKIGTRKMELAGLIYNGLRAFTDKTQFKLAWEMSRSQQLKSLHQTVKSQSFKIQAEYNGKKTNIEEKNALGEYHYLFPSLKLIQVTTDQGKLTWEVLP